MHERETCGKKDRVKKERQTGRKHERSKGRNTKLNKGTDKRAHGQAVGRTTGRREEQTAEVTDRRKSCEKEAKGGGAEESGDEGPKDLGRSKN